MRRKIETNNIDIAEVEKIINDINLEQQWELKKIEVKTDSATVLTCVESLITEESKIQTKGATKMLTKR